MVALRDFRSSGWRVDISFSVVMFVPLRTAEHGQVYLLQGYSPGGMSILFWHPLFSAGGGALYTTGTAQLWTLAGWVGWCSSLARTSTYQGTSARIVTLVGRWVVFGFAAARFAVARIGILVGKRAVFGFAAEQNFRFSVHVCVLRVVPFRAAELDLESSFHAS